MTWLELVTLAVLAVWNQATYTLLEVAARPGLNGWQATKITSTSTAIANTMPAGGALGVGVQTAMYTSYGFAKPDIAISLMTTGVWNTFVKLSMPIVALTLLALSGDPNRGLAAAAFMGSAVVIAAIALFAVVLRSERGAVSAGDLVGRLIAPIWKLFGRPAPRETGRSFADFRAKTNQLLRRRWLPITLTAVISHVTLFVLLLVTLRHVGIAASEVSWQEALAAFAFVRLISVVPITPGGLGVVELGLTAALIAAGGAEAQVVAGVLVFRALTFALPIPVGLVAYLFWRKGAAARALARDLPAAHGTS
jgi:uncharacterized membrane protein YbhN (UPF0104 family)